MSDDERPRFVYKASTAEYDKNMTKTEPIVSAAELEALIRGFGADSGPTTEDKFFPLRFWFVCLVGASYALALLFFSGDIATTLSIHQVEVERIARFLYFRGWFLVFGVSFVAFCYVKDWYLGIVLCAVALVACVNFSFDLFNIYAETLTNPTPRLTFLLMLRVFCLLMVFMCIKNISRVPLGKRRWNIFLPFGRRA